MGGASGGACCCLAKLTPRDAKAVEFSRMADGAVAVTRSAVVGTDALNDTGAG